MLVHRLRSVACLQLACQSSDVDALSALEGDLWPLLTPLQNELLHRVIEELTHPAGEPM
jgi:hypothetical protein